MKREITLRYSAFLGVLFRVLLALMFSGHGALYGQYVSDSKEGNNWYFGFNAGISFNEDYLDEAGYPKYLPGGMVSVLEGVATISDPEGNLLFYTDGISVYTKNHRLMVNGSDLQGDPSSVHSGVIVPNPADKNKYYVWSVGAAGSGGVYYSEVDLTRGTDPVTGELVGEVIASSKNTFVHAWGAEKIAAYSMENEEGFWVVTYGHTTKTYYVHQVTSAGINTSNDFPKQFVIPGNLGGVFGSLKFDFKGERLISTTYHELLGIEMLGFDRTGGTITLLDRIEGGGTYYGAEFSPNGNNLFVSDYLANRILVYDVSGNAFNYLDAIYTNGTCGQLQTGPDGRLYIAMPVTPYLSVINYPDADIRDGDLSKLGFERNRIFLGIKNTTGQITDQQNSGYGLPTFVQSFFASTRPRALFTYTTDCADGNTVSFEPMGDQTDIYRYHWDFGNGESRVVEVDPDAPGAAAKRRISYGYPDAGVYTVRLSVSSRSEEASIMPTSRLVKVGAPLAGFTVEDHCTGGAVPLSNVAGNADSYAWDFHVDKPEEDENDYGSSLRHPVFYYPAAGTYRVSLTVTREGGKCVSTETKTVTVSEGVSLERSVPLLGCAGSEVRFEAVATGPDGSRASVVWDFGDGERSSRQPVAWHPYRSGGQYQVMLTASSGGCERTVSDYILISEPPQVRIHHADIAASPETAWYCPDGSVMLESEILNYQTDLSYSYLWKRIADESGTETEEYLGTGKSQSVYRGGIYELTVGGCAPSTALIEVKSRPAIVAAVTGLTGVSCRDRSDGEALITVTPRGAEQYSILSTILSHSAGYQYSHSGLSEGPQTIAVRDGSTGCTMRVPFEVPYGGPVLNLAQTAAALCEGATGSPSGALSAGVSAGRYSSPVYATRLYHLPGRTELGVQAVSPGIFSGLDRGRYQVESTVSEGGESCTVREHITLASKTLFLSISETIAGCEGALADVEVSSNLYNPLSGFEGSSGVSYSWMPGNHSGESVQLSPGVYEVVAEAEGCQARGSVEVLNIPLPDLTLYKEDLSCSGSNDGRLIVAARNGVGVYSYSWFREGVELGTQSEELMHASAGTYQVRVSDSRRCYSSGGSPLIHSRSATLEAEQELPSIYFSSAVSSGCDVSVELSGPLPANGMVSWYRLDESGESDPYHSEAVYNIAGSGLTLRNAQEGTYVAELSTGRGCVSRSLDHPDSQSSPYGYTVLSHTRRPNAFVLHYAYRYPSGEAPDPDLPEEDDDLLEENRESIELLFNGVAQCQAKQNSEQMAAAVLCLNESNYEDVLSIGYQAMYAHHTLYYYDRKGQLVKTVPPAGVDYLSSAEVASVLSARISGSGSPAQVSRGELILPDHRLVTRYEYNGFGQVSSQSTPDGGRLRFIYDDLQQPRFSQTSEQHARGAYSYNKYDHLGRYIEVGEAFLHSGQDFSSLQAEATRSGSYTFTDPYSAFPVSNRHEVTYTWYSVPHPELSYRGRRQQYLQNNVSYSIRDEDGDLSGRGDQSITVYSYDAHGNVEWLIQDIPGLGPNYLRYSYDLVSGNVREVAFNEHRSDRFYHRYRYDSDNRLVQAETSRDHELWDTDQRQLYRADGQLLATGTGENQIQHTSYTYTAQGWLKALNGEDFVNRSNASGYLSDAYSMSLHYHAGDYENSAWTGATTGLGASASGKSRYNGNISAWRQLNRDFKGGSEYSEDEQYIRKTYDYDILNRILTSRLSVSPTVNGTYVSVWGSATAYRYDANGNLRDLWRNGRSGGPSLAGLLNDEAPLPGQQDALEYYYERDAEGRLLSNRLLAVRDRMEPDAEEGADFGGLHYYIYDEKGNQSWEVYQQTLSKGSTSLDATVLQHTGWDVYGKVASVETRVYDRSELSGGYTTPFSSFSAGQVATLQSSLSALLSSEGFPEALLYRAERLEFGYDATGNRISKRHYRREEPGLSSFSFAGFDRATYTEDLYARDATGNVMGVYKKKVNHEGSGQVVLSLSEQPIYGAQRVGTYAPAQELLNTPLGQTDPYALRYDQAQFRAVEAGTLRHWVNPGSSDTGDGCQCDLYQTSFETGYSHGKSPVTFSGRGSNNVAVAESPEGALLFYAHAPESYMGKSGSLQVYTSAGHRMKGSEHLKGSADDKAAVMASPDNAQRYYLFATNDDQQLLCHTLDLSQSGYGGEAGVVIQANASIGGEYTYGRHKLVIEDPRYGYQLITTRYIEDGSYTELVYFEVTEEGVQPAVVLDTIHGYDLKGEGELQLNYYASQLAYYNRTKYLAGFGYQQVELNLLSLNENRRAVTHKIKVPGAVYGTSGKNSVEYYHIEGEVYLFFNQEGLFKSETDAGYTKVLRSDPDGTLREVDTKHFGDLRRGIDGRLYLASADATGALQYYDLTGNRFYPGDQSTPVSVSDPVSISYLPVQVFRQPEELEAIYSRLVGSKLYELTDHLGNVHAVVTDRRVWQGTEAVPEIYSITDYYPFGSERNSTVDGMYRFGFNGMERDDEVKGRGNSYTTEFRQYDSQTGRWKSVDPLRKIYPALSPYNFVANSPVRLIDADGRIITIPDGQGGQITYIPGMSTDGYSDVTVKHINYLNDVYGGDTKAKIDKLTSSEVEYFIHIGTAKETGLLAVRQPKGGLTTYDFKKNRVVLLVAEDKDATYAILGDELTHATQVEDGDLGFVKIGNRVGSIGYDLEDEIASKRGSVDALKQNNISVDNMKSDHTYESTVVLKIIEEGQDSDENLNRWLDASPTYKSYFPEDGNRMGQHISAEEGAKSYKGYKTFYKLKSKKTEE